MPPSEDDLTEQDFADDPVIGDGIVTIPPIDRKEKMPMDLPDSTGQLLLTESVGNIQNTNVNARNIANIAMGALQAGVARVHNELGTEESRAISGVMATPIAPPATGGA